jgi:hypothetical protein
MTDQRDVIEAIADALERHFDFDNAQGEDRDYIAAGATKALAAAVAHGYGQAPVRASVEYDDEDGSLAFSFYSATGLIVASGTLFKSGKTFAHILNGTSTVAEDRLDLNEEGWSWGAQIATLTRERDEANADADTASCELGKACAEIANLDVELKAALDMNRSLTARLAASEAENKKLRGADAIVAEIVALAPLRDILAISGTGHDLVAWVKKLRDDLAASESARGRLAVAAKNLANTADGFGFREHEIREIAGNTNWNLLVMRIAEVRAAIAEPPA